MIQECILVLVYGTVQTLDEADNKNLDKIKAELVEDYSRGKINANQYESIKNEISMLYEEIYDKKISSLNDILHKIKNGKFPDIVENDVSDAYAKRKINDQHYHLLKEKLSKVTKTDDSNSDT